MPLLVPTLPSGQQKPLELQLPLQHGVPPAVQGELLPVGMHIGVVVEVEVVLVDVEVVGVVVEVVVPEHGPQVSWEWFLR